MGSFRILVKLLCSYLCLFDAIVKLHAMDENNEKCNFSLESKIGF